MTVHARIGARELRGMLQARSYEVIGKLFPQYRITAPVFTPRNPTRHDDRPGSFVIWTTGPAAGGFSEYSPAGPPAKGDIIDLIAYVHRSDRSFAVQWAKDFLGIQQMTESELAARKASAKAVAQAVTASESEAQARKRQAAFKLFLGAERTVLDTVAEVYLAVARGIPFRAIANREEDLRYAPRLGWWKGDKWEGNRFTAPGPKFPAMVAAFRNELGEIVAAHCTFLRSDGSGKADVPNPKLIKGRYRGAVIRLTRGPSDLTPEEAREHGVLEPLIVAEGIETALSVAAAVPEARVWAAGAFHNIQNVPVWHPCVDAVTIAADNDGSAEAEEKLAATVDHLSQFGKPVSVMRAHEGKDFNDLWKG